MEMDPFQSLQETPRPDDPDIVTVEFNAVLRDGTMFTDGDQICVHQAPTKELTAPGKIISEMDLIGEFTGKLFRGSCTLQRAMVSDLAYKYCLVDQHGNMKSEQINTKQNSVFDTQSNPDYNWRKLNWNIQSKDKVSERVPPRLNLVLCGSREAEKTSTANLILGQRECSPESSSVCTRREGEVCGRLVTLVEMPALHNTQLSWEEVMRETLRCISLCDPGVHAFVLVLPEGPLTDEDKGEVEKIQNILSTRVNNHAIVLITHESKQEANMELEETTQAIIQTCRGQHIFLDHSSHVSVLLERVERMVVENTNGCYTSAMYLDAQVETQLKYQNENEELKKTLRAREDEIKSLKESNSVSERVPPRLNLVLCGSREAEKTSTANLILGQRECSPESSSVCTRREGEVCGRLVTLVEMPALHNTQLSWEEVMRETLRCISLCDPGVHAFVLVLPEGPLTDEDKGEVEKIQNMLSTRVNNHAIVLITHESKQEANMELEETTQAIIQTCRGQHIFLDHSSHVSVLLERVERMVVENTNGCYTSAMYLDAQVETQLKYQNENEELKKTLRAREDEIKSLKESNSVSERVPSRLNLVLCGSREAEKTSTANLILGQRECSPESSSVCTRREGEVCGRLVTLVEMPALHNTQLSWEEVMRETLRCISLCDPGVHAFVLVLPEGPLTDEDIGEVEKIQNILSTRVNNHAIVLITHESKQDANMELEETTQAIIQTCRGQHIFLDHSSHVSVLLERVERMVVENTNGCYTSAMYLDAQVETQLKYQNENEELKKTLRAREDEIKSLKESNSVSERVPPRLNLVLCGSREAEKTSTANLILGQRECSPESSSVCTRREGEVCGRLVTLVEMPALHITQLSWEEVMRETLRCISLCDPGVHAFVLVLPEGPLTDEDKGEMEKIQNILSTRVNNHAIVLITHESKQEANMELEETTQAIIQTCRGQHIFLDHSSHVSVLLERVERMVVENTNGCYTSAMYLDAQVETQLKYQNENEELKKTLRAREDEIKSLKESNSGLKESTGELRIVLLGKTGVGKSTTANTILGREVFKKESSSKSVTTVCQKETAEVNGRQITVIDTPGLFDTEVGNDEINKEVAKCISMAPGPHVLLLVLRVGCFTQEEREAVKMIQDTFGDKSRIYTMVLFTGGDVLQKKSIEEFIEECDHNMQHIIQQCGNRYHVFNNKDKNNHCQVTKLLDKIDAMVSVNGGSCYTNDMFQQVEETLREEQDRILKEREGEIEKEKEELRAKYEAEVERMRKTMEEFHEKTEREMKIREEQVRANHIKAEEDYKKRKEEDANRIEELEMRKREMGKEEWERKRREQKMREQEEEQERRESDERQRKEREKFELEMERLKMKQTEEQKKRQQEHDQKEEEEKRKRRDLEEKIERAEESKKNKLKQQLTRQEKEWNKRWQEMKKKMDNEEKTWTERFKLMENKWQKRQKQDQQAYELRRKQENEKRDKKEEKKRKQKEEKHEKETAHKTKEIEEQMKKQQKQYEKERRKEQIEFAKRLENAKARQEEEERRNLNFLKVKHEKEKKDLWKKWETAARKQAFHNLLDEKVKEAKAEGHKEGYEEGKEEGIKEGVSSFLNWRGLS